MATPVYRGRFAPSPTGRLHFGSLVAAVASYADARKARGEWLIRIEDVDETRVQDGAESQLLADLSSFGMSADEPPVRQSERKPLYAAALDQLIESGACYRCVCSRKSIAALARYGIEGPIYPGTCLVDPPPLNIAAAWRLKTEDVTINFEDRIYGPIIQDLGRDIGDFIVRRIDGFTAYQLAVVVDDQTQGITSVVRGADLLWSTPRQIFIQRLLGYKTPRYAHVPLVYDQSGKKLSKRDTVHPIDPTRPVEGLTAAWRHLDQIEPPNELHDSAAFWEWAIPHWQIGNIPADKRANNERADTI